MRSDAAAGAASARMCFVLNDVFILAAVVSIDNPIAASPTALWSWLGLGLLSFLLYFSISLIGPGYVDGHHRERSKEREEVPLLAYPDADLEASNRIAGNHIPHHDVDVDVDDVDVDDVDGVDDDGVDGCGVDGVDGYGVDDGVDEGSGVGMGGGPDGMGGVLWMLEEGKRRRKEEKRRRRRRGREEVGLRSRREGRRDGGEERERRDGRAKFEEPDPGWCKYCQAERPLRAKHCHQCLRCVHRFDHHCFWVGACVGEKNHVYFYAFLVVQTLIDVWTTLAFAESFVDVTPWINGNWIQLIVVLDAGGVGLIPLGLAGYHTYLILTGQTTWEDLRSHAIDYLRDFTLGSPFDRGVVGNVVSFFSRWAFWKWRPQVHHYLPRAVAFASRKASRRDVSVCENPWNNKYYACC